MTDNEKKKITEFYTLIKELRKYKNNIHIKNLK